MQHLLRSRLTARVMSLATAGVVSSMACLSFGAVLLNDSFTDGSRLETNLPNESAVYVGVSGSDGGSFSVVPGALQNIMGTSSRKNWTYFTADLSVPDGNQPHNAVTQLNVGEILNASMSFRLPNGATNNPGSAGRDFRFGIFHDPTDPRVQVDVNSDGGGGTAPWTDALGYAVQIPLNSNPTNTTALFQVGKRTTSNTSLLGSGGAYTFAPTGGAPVAVAANTEYTLELSLSVVSSSQLDVTASLRQGSTVLSTYTVSDTGTAFGGTAIGSGLLPGSQGIYLNFDQLFFRMSSNTTASQVDITNFRVELIPEPASLGLIGLAGLALGRRRRA
ncbi:PEP-CTERM sorting domain-containing protein [Fontivita pretiosa]|uniref:PEP-CTERM sorting domain-containing protein n=1 Tax=Fontivita pretiosa TaxID=2989684 RepID=UPI003D185E6A